MHKLRTITCYNNVYIRTSIRQNPQYNKNRFKEPFNFVWKKFLKTYFFIANILFEKLKKKPLLVRTAVSLNIFARICKHIS